MEVCIQLPLHMKKENKKTRETNWFSLFSNGVYQTKGILKVEFF